MSAIASFIKVPKSALKGLRNAVASGTDYDYLQSNGQQVAGYGWSGYVLATLLPYLQEKHQIDLMKAEYDDIAASLTAATGATHFIFTPSQKAAFLNRLDTALFSEEELRDYFKLSETDVLEAQGKHGGLGMRVLPIFGLLVLIGSLVSVIHDPKQFPSLTGATVVGLFLLFFRRLQVWFSFRRDNRLQDQFEATISDSGIDVSSLKASSKYDWSAFIRYAETKNLFLVYQAPQVFNVFPKRAFAAEEVDTFRGLLDKNLGAASIAYRKKISPRTWAFLIVVAIAAIMLVMAIRNISR